MDWTKSETTQLIRLYKEYECLWNYEHEDYNNQEIKLNAWLDIASACNKEVDDIKRKIKNLRTAYLSQKKKKDARKERGLNYKPNLFYFHEFDFLIPILNLRKSTLPPSSSFSEESNQNKHEDSGDNSVVGRERDINKSKQRKHKIIKMDRKSLRETKFNNAIDAIVASVKQMPSNKAQRNAVVDEDDSDGNIFDSFGKTTALHLQQLPVGKATEVMAAIYQLLAKKMLLALSKSRNPSRNARRNGVISFESMSP